MACNKKCEVYSRIVGYFRPVANWNIGKKEEFKDRLTFDNEKALVSEFVKDSTGLKDTITEVSETEVSEQAGAIKIA